MEFVDPWRGMVEGSKAIYSMGKEAKEQARQSELDKLAREKWGYEKADLEAKQAERKALLDYEQTLRDLRTKKITETLPEKDNPEYADYQSGLSALTTAQYPEAPKDVLDNSLASAMQAEGLVESTPSPEGRAASLAGAVPPAKLPAETVTRPLSPFEYYKEAEQARMQYDPTGARKAGGVDITAEVMRSAPLKMMEAHQKGKMALDMYAQGRSPEEIAQFLGMPTEEVVKGLQETKQIAPGILYRETNGLGITLNYTGKGDPVHVTKLPTEKPVAEWRDLGVEKHGRQEVLVQQNVQTGEKKYTKLSPETVGSSVRMEMPVPVIDTQNDNAVTFATRNEINANPGRYLPSTGATTQKSLDKQNLLSDIKDNVTDAKNILATMPEFSAKQAAQISLALSHSDGAIKSAALQQVNKMLTPEQQQYVIKLNQLAENSMAMRTVLGMGQGSKDVRDAIKATLPSAKSPSKSYAAQQLNALETTLGRLERGVPKVPLRGQQKGQLDAATAKQYLQQAGGDKAKARELAKADGWSF